MSSDPAERTDLVTNHISHSQNPINQNMSLPSSYSAILSDLNREVLRSQPSDPLQFCANWFASRLEQERAANRSGSGGNQTSMGKFSE